MLATQDDFNDFTAALREKIRLTGPVICQVRDQFYLEVTYLEPGPDIDYEPGGFVSTSPSCNYRWYNNGEALSSRSHDLIQFNS